MRRLLFVVACLILVLAPFCLWATTANANISAEATWLNVGPVTATKTLELDANHEPFSMGLDCVPTDFPTGRTNTGSLYHGCVMQEPFGKIASNYYVNGPYGTLTIELSNRGYFLPPSAHGLVTFTIPSSWSYGAAINIGNKVSSTPKFTSIWGWPPKEYYTYEITPEKTLSDASGQPIHFDWQSAAYSPNGEYMTVLTSTGGIMLYDTATFHGKTIGWNYGNMFYEELKGNNLTVSNDGRYVAINANLASRGATPIPTLKVYDTTTCTDQSSYESNRKAGAPCRYKDLWTGTLDGVSVGGISAAHPELEYPRHVKFTADGSLTFDSVYARTSPTSFSVARYTIPFGGAVVEPIRLLALGDSYISGEGAYSYRDGTDTSNNKCHQSTVSYPYLLGESFATEYHSAACSGATTEDIVPVNDKIYAGQVKDDIEWAIRSDNDKNDILAQYLPGYAGQNSFVGTSEANTILLSIGGNDVGFKNILQRCVLSIAGNPCYNKKSERLSLLKTIYSKHKVLTATYSKILEESPKGEKLYVVGYPQVVSSTGSCGVNVHLDGQERTFAVALIERLNATIKNAAEAAGAIYVDNSNALVGHRLCDGNDDGMNGVTAGDDMAVRLPFVVGGFTLNFSFGIGNESYHPTAFGHQLLSESITKATDNLTKKPKAPTGAGPLTVTGSESFVMAGDFDEAEVRRINFDKIVNTSVATKNQSLDVLSGINSNVAPGADYSIVIHSQEVVLGSGKAGSDGSISTRVTVPNIEPGIHSLHIYTTDTEGEPIDITQDIFIIASTEDYDGDGINNIDDVLPFVNETDQIIVSTDSIKESDTTNNSEDGTGDTQDVPEDVEENISQAIAEKADIAQVQVAAAPSSAKQSIVASNQTIEAITGVETTQNDKTNAVERNKPEVLGTSTESSQYTRTDGRVSDEKSTSRKVWDTLLIVIVFLLAVMGLVIGKSKRSKRRSGRI